MFGIIVHLLTIWIIQLQFCTSKRILEKVARHIQSQLRSPQSSINGTSVWFRFMLSSGFWFEAIPGSGGAKLSLKHLAHI